MKINKIFNNKYIKIDLSKNAKPPYYLRNILIFLTPSRFYQNKLSMLLNHTQNSDLINKRVNYYNKLNSHTTLNEAKTIKAFRKEKKKTYFFDLYKYLTYFNENFKITYLFGDITTVPKEPTLLKSRPIGDENQNSILLNLNKVRHFIFLDDEIPFKKKQSLLVWRGKAHQEHRQFFLKKYHNNPLCDVGQISKKQDGDTIKWEKPKMSLQEHLKYKFILTIEGNDVASNLKWVMSSNSLAFMAKPKYETWFMEGQLIPNYHYVLLKNDYSDVEEKIEYYSKNIDEAEKIIANAHTYIEQFQDAKREDIISLLVLKKYFKHTSQ